MKPLMGHSLDCEGDSLPATNLTYYDAVLYANERSKAEGFDTAYTYAGSEECLGRFIERYDCRDRLKIATKLPAWEMKTKEDRDRIFMEQLERTGAGYFDFYLLHSIEDGNIKVYEDLDCFNWGLQKKEEGVIRHFGFSFHGSPELLKRVLDEHPEMQKSVFTLSFICIPS